MPFVKLDTKILTSSLWLDFDARTVFITALVMARPEELTEPTEQIEVNSLAPTGWVVPPGWYGLAEAAGPGIVGASGLSQEAGLAALERLCAPDQSSRSQEFEGRRMARINGGYLILNFMRYRDKDYSAASRVRRYRERLALRRNAVTSRNVTQADSREQNAEISKETALSGSKARKAKEATTAAQEALFGGVAGDQFEEFWKAYPSVRKQGKGNAKKAWTAASLKPSWPGFDGIMAAVEKAKRSKSWADGYVPMPATWLNQERWTDEWPEDEPSAPSRRSASAAAKRVLR